MLEIDEFLKSIEERIKKHQDDYNRFTECGALNMAQIATMQMELLHKVKADYVLKRNGFGDKNEHI